MKRFIKIIAPLFLALAFCVPAIAGDAAPKPSVLITNANIFDGTSEKLATGMSVLVEGNKIAKIAKSIPASDGAMVIDAEGRTLMPGLSDAHWHTIQTNLTNAEALSSDLDYITLAAAVGAEQALMRGFTTIRDVGGPVFGLKKMIDAGVYKGPRIYPSGAYINTSPKHPAMPISALLFKCLGRIRAI